MAPVSPGNQGPKGDRMGDPEPRAAPPAEKAPRIRGKLFRKYVALFLSVVCIALLTSGLSEIWFSYRLPLTAFRKSTRPSSKGIR